MFDRPTMQRHLFALVAVALACAGSTKPSPQARMALAPWQAMSLDGRTGGLAARGARRLAAASWVGGTYQTSGGEHVRVFVSTAYADAEARGQQWADYFASLPHGAELAGLTAYIAPIQEVEEICGSAHVLGCYGGQRLVTMGDGNHGVSALSVATHEYGHHIALNRLNAPWAAVDWGTKRWASYEGVCARVADGTAFPGNESSAYPLNPGEAFAESYRVLVETGGTAVNYDWNIVDPSFRPDAQALALLKQDVLEPWAPAPTRTLRGTFARRGRTWSTPLPTPLDGQLRIRLTVPNHGVDGLALVGDGGRVVATGSWTGQAGDLEYSVCGTRSLNVRVTRGGPAARFTLRIDAP